MASRSGCLFDLWRSDPRDIVGNHLPGAGLHPINDILTSRSQEAHLVSRRASSEGHDVLFWRNSASCFKALPELSQRWQI